MHHEVSGDLGIRKDHTFSTHECCCIKGPFLRQLAVFPFFEWTLTWNTQQLCGETLSKVGTWTVKSPHCCANYD